MKKYLLPLIFILLLSFTLIGNCAWLAGWDYRIELEINDYAGDIGAEVVWWPATVFLTAAQCEEVFVELTTDAEYNKVAFTKADGDTELFGDCELFNVAGELGIYHISRAGWTINANTKVYMYYDKDHADNDTYISMSGGVAAQSVWDGNFEAVYHMNDGAYDVLNECDATTDWAATDGTRSIDTGDKHSGTGSLKFVTDPAVGEGYVIYNPSGTWDWSSKTHLKLWIKGDTAEDGQLFIFDAGSNWEYWDFTYPTDWTLMSFDLSAPIGDDGTGCGDWSDITQIRLDINAADKIARYDELRIYPGTTTIVDSTSNYNNGAKKDIDEPVEAGGEVGQGQDFDGTDDYINCGDICDFGTDDFTVELITVANNIQNVDFSSIVDKDNAGGMGWKLYSRNSDGYMRFIIDGTFGSPAVGTDIIDGNPYHIAVAADRSGDATFYVNGSVDGTLDISGKVAANLNSGDLHLGWVNTQEYKGIQDEIRISDTLRTAAWIKGTTNTLLDALFTYGVEETEAVAEVNVINFGANF